MPLLVAVTWLFGLVGFSHHHNVNNPQISLGDSAHGNWNGDRVEVIPSAITQNRPMSIT
jgi:hypothetical protein